MLTAAVIFICTNTVLFHLLVPSILALRSIS
jgi:hypothetical protein